MDLKIKLKIKDVEIELDKKELQELKQILGDLFPKEKEYVPYYPYYPYYRTYPYWEVIYTTTPNTTSGGDAGCTISYNSQTI